MQKGADYEASDKILSFVADFIHLSTELQRTVPMIRLSPRYSGSFTDMEGDTSCVHGARRRKIDWQENLKRFKRILVVMLQALGILLGKIQ